MEILGYSQLSMTMDLYSHVMPTAPNDAADAVEQALEGSRSQVAAPVAAQAVHGQDPGASSGL
jgi:hypothetical protein